jgi:hypothetical protein
MTMTMNSLMSEERQEPPPPRGPRRSLLAMPTSEVKLSPEFVRAIKSIAPKARRHTLRYILLLAVLVAAGSLAVVPSARHRVAAAANNLWHRVHPASAIVPSASSSLQPTAPAGEVPAPVVSVQPIVIPPVVISSATTDTSSSSAKPSKSPRKWQRGSPR